MQRALFKALRGIEWVKVVFRDVNMLAHAPKKEWSHATPWLHLPKQSGAFRVGVATHQILITKRPSPLYIRLTGAPVLSAPPAEGAFFWRVVTFGKRGKNYP